MGLAIWLIALMGVAILSFMYYAMYEIFTLFSDSLSVIFPATFNQAWFVFVENYWWWIPLTIIMLGLTYWVFVQSQREAFQPI